jgi:hypothetical protein
MMAAAIRPFNRRGLAQVVRAGRPEFSLVGSKRDCVDIRGVTPKSFWTGPGVAKTRLLSGHCAIGKDNGHCGQVSTPQKAAWLVFFEGTHPPLEGGIS